MENEKKIKISLSGVFLMVAIIIIIVMGIYIYNVIIQKNEEVKKSESLEKQVIELKENVNNLENTIKTIKSVVSNENSNNTNTNNNTISDNNSTEEITVDLDVLTLKLPSSWKDKYQIKENKVDNIKIYGFYNLANYEINGRDGELFGIQIYEAGDTSYEQFPSYKVIEKNSKYNIIVTFPTDVNYNYEDEKLAKDYETMKKDVNKIVASIIVK